MGNGLQGACPHLCTPLRREYFPGYQIFRLAVKEENIFISVEYDMIFNNIMTGTWECGGLVMGGEGRCGGECSPALGQGWNFFLQNAGMDEILE